MDSFKPSGLIETVSGRTTTYASEYAFVLSFAFDRHIALAELRLFRFWLHVCAQQPDPDDMSALSPLCPTNPLPMEVDGISIAETLGHPVEQLVKRRFELYNRFYIDGRHGDDPLGLHAVALALSYQLCIHPPRIVRSYLEQNTIRHWHVYVTSANNTKALRIFQQRMRN